MRDITPGDADGYKLHLVGKKLAPMTVRKRLQFATMIFRAAVRRRLIAESPFADVSVKASMPEPRAVRDAERKPTSCWPPARTSTGGRSSPWPATAGCGAQSKCFRSEWQDMDWEARPDHRAIAQDGAPPGQGDAGRFPCSPSCGRSLRSLPSWPPRAPFTWSTNACGPAPRQSRLAKLQPADAIRADRQAGRADALAAAVPQPAEFAANGAGREFPLARRLRLAGQQRRHRPASTTTRRPTITSPGHWKLKGAAKTAQSRIRSSADSRRKPRRNRCRKRPARFLPRKADNPRLAANSERGWGGIRTPVRITPKAVFKTAAFDRSATHPGCEPPRSMRRTRARPTLTVHASRCQLYACRGESRPRNRRRGPRDGSGCPRSARL